jgi:hypothetical protein
MGPKELLNYVLGLQFHGFLQRQPFQREAAFCKQPLRPILIRFPSDAQRVVTRK